MTTYNAALTNNAYNAYAYIRNQISGIIQTLKQAVLLYSTYKQCFRCNGPLTASTLASYF